MGEDLFGDPRFSSLKWTQFGVASNFHCKNFTLCSKIGKISAPATQIAVARSGVETYAYHNGCRGARLDLSGPQGL